MPQIFILSGTLWTVPADWNSANNSIETIGGGGGGQTADYSFAGSGGGGGAYSKSTNVSLIGGDGVAIQIGSGGAPGAIGGDTWFDGTNLATAAVGAAGGSGGGDNHGGAGGNAATGKGTTRFSGGDGGAVGGNNPYCGAAGGGAAGPNGNGAAGGTPNNQITAGAGGGGGSSGGSVGGIGDGPTGNGGVGGNGYSGMGGGAGDTGSGAGNGTPGTGGGGGGGKYASHTNGGDGATGSEFDGSHGSGGGGGGGGGRDFNNSALAGNGGIGANYGGGGGGGGYPQIGSNFGAGGVGGQGIIVLTYAPRASTTITAECWNTLEVQGDANRDQPSAIEFGSTFSGDSLTEVEARSEVSRSAITPLDSTFAVRADVGLRNEWGTGSFAITSDSLMLLEFVSRIVGDIRGTAESGRILTSDAQFRFELPQTLAGNTGLWSEILTLVKCDSSLRLESLAVGARLISDELLSLEWADPPALLLVSRDRLLRSPGRIRILAGPASTHPLRTA